MSFLDRSFELHFNERPYLNHFSYLFITKTTRERSRSRSNFSILCRGNIIPKEVRDKDAVSRFLESVDQFERILNDSVFIRLERLTATGRTDREIFFSFTTGHDHTEGYTDERVQDAHRGQYALRAYAFRRG